MLCPRMLALALAATALFFSDFTLPAQQQPPGGGAAGIEIDPDGIVRPIFAPARDRALARQRMQAAAGALPGTLGQPSELRKVSLVKLEAAYAAALAAGGEVPTEIRHVAGLQRIDYVFVYPETGDLVIAGPADGFAPDPTGRVVGLESGRPTLRLDDLVLALRTIRERGTIGCSIDPEPERLAAFNRYVAQNSSATTTSTVAQRFQRMAQILGLQNVTVWGVPADSHFAAVLVEADFRMKQIAMGLEQPRVRGLRSHLSMLGGGGNSMQRWWITPLYDALFAAGDGNAYQIVGQRAQLMSQEEYADAQGNRTSAASTRKTTELYAKHFTEHFPALADKSPVFAELQNLIDLSLLAALIRQEGLAERVDWPMATFLDDSLAVYEPGNVPRQVPTSANYRRSSSRLIVGLVGGGVTIDGTSVLRQVPRQAPGDSGLDQTYRRANTKPADAGAWWWD